MSQSTGAGAVATTPALHASNIFGSPGSTWTGGAAIMGVLSASMANGMPTTSAGWVAFVVSIVMGIGGIFSKG